MKLEINRNTIAKARNVGMEVFLRDPDKTRGRRIIAITAFLKLVF